MLQAVFITEELAIRQGHESSRSVDAIFQKDNINTEVQSSLAVGASYGCVFIVFHTREKRRLVKKDQLVWRAIRVLGSGEQKNIIDYDFSGGVSSEPFGFFLS